MRGAPLGLVALVLVLSGCLSPDQETVSAPALDEPGPTLPADLLAGVPCEAASVDTTSTSENLRQVANLTFDVGDHAELDIRDGLAIYSTHGAGGFEILDMTDLLHPALLSTYAGDEGTSLDVKLHPDGTTVFQAVNRGIEIVDIRDRTAPVRTGLWELETLADVPVVGDPTQGSAHMIFVHAIDNVSYLFIASQDEKGVTILRVEGEPGAYTLTPVGQAGTTAFALEGAHDIWVTFDDRIETHILYIANGFAGWLAYDVDDPTAPQLLGGTINADTHQGYIHTVQARWLGERRILVTISEVGANAMRVYDATDLSLPLLLGSWDYDLPVLFQHNLQFVNGTLFFSHYAQGVFVFDIDQVGTVPYGQLLQLEPTAHYSVEESTWDVSVQDGLLVVGDSAMLHIVGYGCFAPGDGGITSDG